MVDALYMRIFYDKLTCSFRIFVFFMMIEPKRQNDNLNKLKIALSFIEFFSKFGLY